MNLVVVLWSSFPRFISLLYIRQSLLPPGCVCVCVCMYTIYVFSCYISICVCRNMCNNECVCWNDIAPIPAPKNNERTNITIRATSSNDDDDSFNKKKHKTLGLFWTNSKRTRGHNQEEGDKVRAKEREIERVEQVYVNKATSNGQKHVHKTLGHLQHTTTSKTTPNKHRCKYNNKLADAY